MAEFKINDNEKLYELLGDVEKFNGFLSNFAEHILRKALMAVPALVIHHIKNETNYDRIKKEFFDKNPELLKYQQVVKQQLNVVAAEHTDWTIEQVFNEVGLQSKQLIRNILEEKK
jgi:predicted patatin/cPLA2 family phospholipase